MILQKNLELNNGSTYEEKLKSIHEAYTPEFYKYVNSKSTYQQKFYNFEEYP